MALHTRVAHGFDIDAAARLTAHSFPDAARSPELRQAQLRDPNFGGGTDSLLVGEIDGELVAACQVHPLRMWLGGTLLPVAGVGTVAVSPTRRKQGLAAELVVGALRMARDRGDVASALYPFRESFYRALGYGAAGVVEQYHVPVSALPLGEERARVELLDETAGEALALYNTWAASQTGQLERGERVWEELSTAPMRNTFGYRAEHGALEGYARVVYRNELPPPQRYLEVEELVWTSPAARRGLYGWLASLGDQWHHVLLRALPSHRTADWLSEVRLPFGAAPSWNLWAPAATLLAGPMLRIVDMAGAWAVRSVADDAALSCTLIITDEQLPENAGDWTLRLEAGRASVARGADGGAVIRTDIATLSRLYAGAVRASDARAAGLLLCEDAGLLAALDGALAAGEFWLFDRF